MSLLGVDVGTTGCKAIAFDEAGRALAAAYREYDVQRPQAGWSELDAPAVWELIKQCLREVAGQTQRDPVTALSVASLGEAVVPVTTDRDILGPSLLNDDVRGAEFLPRLTARMSDAELYAINGNTWGNHYTLPKLLWLKHHEPAMYEEADYFLHWGALVNFMLGAQARVDFALANRTLLFDIAAADWSPQLLKLTGMEREKLPQTVASGTIIGQVSSQAAAETGLPAGAAIVSGAHDQCANAVGCGAVRNGRAMLGFGTYLCLTPVYAQRPEAAAMIKRGLNTEHHAAPGLYASFIYNQGGALLKWYRDTFAAAENAQARAQGQDIYPELLAEMPTTPSNVRVLPHFTATGPPEFITDSRGVMLGMGLDTQRGEVLRGLLEGAAFYLRESLDTLPSVGIEVDSVAAVGGGSKSDRWVQLTADIFGIPFARPRETEAGALGAAILAGAATGVYDSIAGGAEDVVQMEQEFTPNAARHAAYEQPYQQYRKLWPMLREYLQDMARTQR